MTDGELTAIESWWADQDAISMRPSSAFAHDDVRKLIAEVRRLREENDKLRAALHTPTATDVANLAKTLANGTWQRRTP